MLKNTKCLIVFSFFSLFSTAAFSAYNEMHKAVDGNNINEIENLLNTKATLLQEFDDNGDTPLHKAILDDKNASLQTFMKFKRYINTQIVNYNGDTPLVYAIKNKKYNSIIFMLDNGINPFYKDSRQKNSLDYVKENGDITTKQIYNEYYSRNRDKIIRLQESFKDPIDLGIFKDESSISKNTQDEEPKYKKPKISTVQDLLIGNSRAKSLAMVGSAEPEAFEDKPSPLKRDVAISEPIKNNEATKEAVESIKDKMDQVNVDSQLVKDMQERINLLEKENGYLKNKVDLKIATGKDELSTVEENIARSQYAGIYEQQIAYGDITTNEAGIPVFDAEIISNDDLPVISDSIDYKTATMKTLNNIEQEFPAISSNIEKAIKNDVESEKIVLPIDSIPEKQAIVLPTLDKKENIDVKVEKSEIIDNNNKEENINVKSTDLKETENVKTNPVNDMGKIEVKEIKPILKIEEAKSNFKSEFSKKMTTDTSVALILLTLLLGIISFIVFGVISYKDYKTKKNNKNVVKPKKEVDDIKIEVTKKDKI